MTPRLSILIVTRNRVELLRRSLDSILREVESDYPEAEVVVIDGGSTDGTVELLQQYDHRLGSWRSEPDSGVAEGVNRGLKLVRGDVVRLVGDDDEFLPGRLRLMMELVDAMPQYSIIAGHNRVLIEDEAGQATPQETNPYSGEIVRDDLYQWGGAGILIPEVCFFRREALQRLNGYDESWRWWGFLDLFLRMINRGERFFVVPAEILVTYQTPRSETFSNLENPRFWKEYLDVIEKNCGPKWRRWHQYDRSFHPRKILRYYRRRLRDTMRGKEEE